MRSLSFIIHQGTPALSIQSKGSEIISGTRRSLSNSKDIKEKRYKDRRDVPVYLSYKQLLRRQKRLPETSSTDIMNRKDYGKYLVLRSETE